MYDKLNNLLCNKTLLNDVKMLSIDAQTSCLEGFHATLQLLASKASLLLLVRNSLQVIVLSDYFLCYGSIICVYWKVILLVFANCLVWFTVVFSLTNQIKFVIAQLAYSSVRKYISLHNNCKCIHVSLSCCLLGKLTLVLFSL